MLYEVLKTAKMGAGKAPDLCTAIMAQKMPFAKGIGEEHEYTGAVPVTFTANGQPLLDYLISGNTVQSGTPTPDSPVMPQGTGERTENLAKYWKSAFVRSDGSVATNNVNGISFPVKLEASQTVSFTNQKTNFGRGFAVFSGFDGETLTDMVYRSTNSTAKYTADSDCYVVIWGNYDNTTSMDESVFALCGQMLNLGSTALPYEPHGYKIPISSASTTTPVYLGEVETTRKIKKLVLTGTETVAGSAVTGGWMVTNLSDSINNTVGVQTAYCSHFVAKNNGAMSSLSQGEMCISTQVNNRINFVTAFATAEDFKAYLAAQYAAGTPVCVWYVLSTSQTAVVNEPLMRIGDYTDSISMEQTGVEIPTARGTNTLDVLTDVKPSEVYIKYKE